MLPHELEYLFTARFRDGTLIHQTPADCSATEPLTRSAFYDVAQRIAEVESFTLNNGRSRHTVFLADGHFETWHHGRQKVLTNPHGELTNFRLIYFRRVHAGVTAGGKALPGMIVLYVIGWQANDEHGKNFQMHLEIKPDGLGAPVLK